MKTPAAIAAVVIALGAPGTGAAGDDEDEKSESVTRVACVGGTAELRLEAESDGDDDEARGEIEIELRVNSRHPVSRWRLVLLHERRIVYQGARLSVRDGHAMQYWQHVPDWAGRQVVAARLATPSGRTCRLEATI